MLWALPLIGRVSASRDRRRQSTGPD
jgi:hypothetical protein